MPKRLLYGAAGGALVVLLMLALLAVLRASDESAPGAALAAPPTRVTTTTIPPTTTLTTTTIPPSVLTFEGELPEVEALVAELYRSILDPTSPKPAGLPDYLESALAGAIAPDRIEIDAATHWAALKYGQQVAVVTAGDDVVLAVVSAEGEDWQIVGAKLPRFGLGPLYGPAVRRVLIIGSDARWPHDPLTAQGDSLHIVTAVPDERAGAIVGIPRDSWVPRPDGRNGKITSTLLRFGPDGVVDSVEAWSGVDVEGYIITGFLGFEQLMGNFGPLDITLPRAIRGSPASFPSFPEGPQTIAARDLLLLARIRKSLPDGDFDRSRNHGLIMKAGLEAVQGRGIAGLPELIRILEDSTWNNLGAARLLTLGATALELDVALVENRVLPGRNGRVGEAAVVFVGDGALQVFADLADDGLLEAS